ncbi:Uncharacterised protein [Serratia proteamaculans]|nr:Uncharacterised protein [Serratia proteamaculans]
MVSYLLSRILSISYQYRLLNIVNIIPFYAANFANTHARKYGKIKNVHKGNSCAGVILPFLKCFS